MAGWRRSLWDTVLVARFEVLRAVRTWRALALLLVYVVVSAGGAYVFIEALSAIEDQIAATLGVPTTRWPGAMAERVRTSDEARQLIQTLAVADEATVDQLLARPLLAVFQLWQGLVFIPFLVATSAAESLALDMRTRALRFEALRTGRAELVAGRFLGQCVLAAGATAVSLVVVWGMGLGLMVQQDPLALAWGLATLGGRALIFALPFAGFGIALSSLTTSPAWARMMAIVGVAGSWVVWGIAHARERNVVVTIADAISPLLPQSWMAGLWGDVADWTLSLGVCAAIAIAVVGVGILRFEGRDL